MVADDILVKMAQSGDQTAYGELVRRYQDLIFSLTGRMLSSPEDARDASQETFIKVYKALPGFDFRASFTTWLYKVATNVCLDLLRKQSREQQRRLSLGEVNIQEGSFKDNRPGPEDLLLERERIQELKQAVQALPEGYRLALILHHYQGLSYQQIARILELPEKTVATRIHRAKKKLKDGLRGGEGDAVLESKDQAKPVPGWRMSVF